ncbi:metallophosphoesterase family protein [Mesobacillus zeae]|uniref:DNA repair exonuclease n=1 Tax=Mesobacillus zeae TaxID=1917180 RepID=A0A398B4Y6_9BACI|nr:DNA repair exonuclease [Mesobacillus zeae]RID84631.1 DNA repair exonuclease [Mesobacillus zeae]
MKEISFIHSADLHLDSPMTGLKALPETIFKRLRQSTFKALANIVDKAIEHQVDFVILAGDIFDGEDRSLKAQSGFRKEMERLGEEGIPAYVIHGNHDHLGGNWPRIELPSNVHIFSDKLGVEHFSKKDGTSVNLYGFSYPERHVQERWINQYEKEDGADFHIGILHGHSEGDTEHGRYAPFTLPELVSKRFDYWALGHIHKRRVLSEDPPVIYPGNPQGRNRKESGPKGCYLVKMYEGGTECRFIETNDIVWQERHVDGSALDSAGTLYRLCRSEIEQVRESGKGTLLLLRIDHVDPTVKELTEAIDSGEMLEILQEDESEEESFVWIAGLTFSRDFRYDREALKAHSEFYGELFSVIDQYDRHEDSLAPLYSHSIARRHTEEQSEETRREVLEEAERMLVELFESD